MAVFDQRAWLFWASVHSEDGSSLLRDAREVSGSSHASFQRGNLHFYSTDFGDCLCNRFFPTSHFYLEVSNS